MTGPQPPFCPECQAGKCSNCSGDTWDNERDALAPCPCSTTDHQRRTA